MSRIQSRLLAILLHLSALFRNWMPRFHDGHASSALVWRWALGAVSLAGIYHGASAASSITPSSVTATNQVAFTQRFIVNDNTSVLYGNARSYTATNLPPGLSIIQTGASRGIVSGTPTASGTFHAIIVGWSRDTPGFGIESFQSPQKVVFTVLAGTVSPPVITTGPHSAAVHTGESFQWQATVSGTGPFSYQWLSNNTALPGGTNSALVFTNPVPAMTARYNLKVTNAGGSTVSGPADLLVGGPLACLAPVWDSLQGIGLRFAGLTNRLYSIETQDTLSGAWSPLGPGVNGAGATNIVWELPTSDVQRFYRIRTAD